MTSWAALDNVPEDVSDSLLQQEPSSSSPHGDLSQLQGTPVRGEAQDLHRGAPAGMGYGNP